MSAAFVPTFTQELTIGGKPRAWQLANSVITALLLITGVLVPARRSSSPGRSCASTRATSREVPGKLELTVYLARIMAPFLTLVAVAAVFMGMLNALGHFFIPALSPAMFNVATIVIAVALVPFAPSLGVRPIVHRRDRDARRRSRTARHSVAAAAERRAIAIGRALDFRDPALGRVLLLMGPGTIGMAATQINVLVNTQFASSQGTGAISWLDYAFRVMYLPIGLFGVSIAAASTPALSRLAATNNTPQMRSTVASAIGLMLALNCRRRSG